jgi:hypothetical protein
VPGFDPWTVQPLASRLTDYMIFDWLVGKKTGTGSVRTLTNQTEGHRREMYTDKRVDLVDSVMRGDISYCRTTVTDRTGKQPNLLLGEEGPR